MLAKIWTARYESSIRRHPGSHREELPPPLPGLDVLRFAKRKKERAGVTPVTVAKS